MRDVEMEGWEDFPLNEEALDAAINQAEEAVRAGYEEQQQLIDGIKAYCFVSHALNGGMLQPVSVEHAKDMIRAAEVYLNQHNEAY